MVKRLDVCNKALEYKDTPFHHQGRLKGVNGGIDCAGLIVCVARELLIPHSDLRGYRRIPDGVSLRKVIEDNTAKKKTLADALPGDILLMKFVNEPQHVALLLPNNEIIHSLNEGEHKVTIHQFDEYWRSKVLAVYEYQNIE
jgi:cell wall-associated NlpC family hydrolase